MGRKKNATLNAIPTMPDPDQMAATMEMMKSFVASQQALFEKSGAASKLKSTAYDHFSSLDFMGSRPKQSRVTWQMLRRMSLACKPVAAIIQTRQNQVAAFTQIPRRTGDIGFRITTKNPTKKPTAGDLERMHELTNWFMNMGYDQYDNRYYEGERRRDNFDSFIRKIVRDTLTLDAVAFEVQRSARGTPYALFPVDPGSIKFAAEKWQFDPKTGQTIAIQPEMTDGLPVRYVQELYNGVRVAVFNDRDLMYAVRNPRTDATVGGYGLSELEILMETVTQILFAEQYNAKFFTQNSLPQGILNIAGKYTPEALESFKRQWIAQVTGVANAWRVPIMAIDDAQGGVKFEKFSDFSNRDMQYNVWVEYLISSACAVYTIDPSEIGFVMKGAGGGPMVEASGGVKIDFSKDKGLRPLLKFLGSMFNDLVAEMQPDLQFEWVGIDAMSETEKIELTTKKINSGIMTVNEARAIEDMDEIKSNWANAPANSTLIQVYVADMTYQRTKADAAEQASAAGPGMAPPAGGPGQPGAAPGAPPAGGPPGAEAPPDGGTHPITPDKSGQAKINRNPSPADNGAPLPLPSKAKKDTASTEFAQAREEEKEGGKELRDEKKSGLKKSVDEDGVIEIVIE
jgi:hypothetical protein